MALFAGPAPSDSGPQCLSPRPAGPPRTPAVRKQRWRKQWSHRRSRLRRPSPSQSRRLHAGWWSA